MVAMGRVARLCIIIDEANHRDQHASAHPHLKPCKIDRPKCDEDHTILGSMHLMLEIVLGVRFGATQFCYSYNTSRA